MGLVHLIRHGEPARSGVLLGSTDVELRSVSFGPASFVVNTVFSSPLRRARQTAEILFPHQEAIVLDALAERDFGDWEGLSWQMVEQQWPDLARLAASDWLGTTPPGGERWAHFVERVTTAWNVIRQAERPIAVVAHIGVNAVLAELIAGRKSVKFCQVYLEVISFELEP